MKRLHNSEEGMAAIIVTVVLMMVISLITIGFSQVIRREQRNTLDHQLATQAYYAAESGINLAQSKLKTFGVNIPAKTNCDESYPGAPSNFSGQFNIASGVDVTCLFIQPKVPTLEFQKVDTHAVPMLVKSDSGTVNTITISWQNSTSTSTVGCTNALNPPANSFGPTTGASPNWSCPQPLLRVDVVALPTAGIMTRNDLINKQFTTFLYPTTGSPATPIGYNFGVPAAITGNRAVHCGGPTTPSSPKICTARIDVTSAPIGYKQQFAVRVMSIYGISDITLFANAAGSTNLVDQQVLIDSTAKAQDVLRRIQVRASVSGTAPDFGLLAGGDGSGGICKRYAISAGTVVNPVATYPACAIP